MTILQVAKICQVLKLDPLQVIGLFYAGIGEESPFGITTDAYKDLYNRQYVYKDMPTPRYLDLVTQITDTDSSMYLTKPIVPSVHEKLKEIIPQLQATLMYSKPSEDEEERVMAFFKEETVTALYLTWLWLFPTSVDLRYRNASWDHLFGIKYDGVRLRGNNEGAMKNFAAIGRRCDLGIYIFATYRFIKDGIGSDGRAYISKQANFFKVQDDWYNDTKSIVESKTTPEILQYFVNQPRKNVAVGANLI